MELRNVRLNRRSNYSSWLLQDVTQREAHSCSTVVNDVTLHFDVRAAEPYVPVLPRQYTRFCCAWKFYTMHAKLAKKHNLNNAVKTCKLRARFILCLFQVLIMCICNNSAVVIAILWGLQIFVTSLTSTCNSCGSSTIVRVCATYSGWRPVESCVYIYISCCLFYSLVRSRSSLKLIFKWPSSVDFNASRWKLPFDFFRQ
jgi:hypothetical protein